MIHFVRGEVASIAEDYAVLDVQGIGYQVFATTRVLALLTVGQVAQLYTYHHIREDAQALYGLADELEREVFMQLIKVNGVGAKVAMAILSTLTVSDLSTAIWQQDAVPFTQVSGVGKKLAERLVLELKGKISAPISGSVTKGGAASAAQNSVDTDVISALMNLGYKAPLAQKAVTAAREVMTEKSIENIAFDNLLKQSLQEARAK